MRQFQQLLLVSCITVIVCDSHDSPSTHSTSVVSPKVDEAAQTAVLLSDAYRLSKLQQQEQLNDPLKESSEDEKRAWGSNNMRVWGKRDQLDIDSEAKRAWGSNNMRVWGKRDNSYDDDNDLEKRAWGSNNMRVWGKRAIDDIDEDKRTWGTNNMRVWGKRDNEEDNDEKRSWGTNNMRVWGKRDVSDDEMKRSWGTNNMRVWGKRHVADADELDKRTWGTNNMRVWGKRTWGTNNMRVWGKRDGEKRTWGTNNMRVWGKRDDNNEDKRTWGTNNMRVWGKRDLSSVQNKLTNDITSGKEHRTKRSVDDVAAFNDAMKLWEKRIPYSSFAETPSRTWKTNVVRVWGRELFPEYDD